MEKRMQRIKERLTDSAGLSTDVLLDMTNFFYDGRALRCDNHKGLIEYTLQCVRFKTSGGEVRATGSGLKLGEYGNGVIEVEGKIDKIEFL
jgi:sporulation protein YqfC